MTVDSVTKQIHFPDTEQELLLWAMEHDRYAEYVLEQLRLYRIGDEVPMHVQSFYKQAGIIIREAILHMFNRFPSHIRIKYWYNDQKRKKMSIECAGIFMISLGATEVDEPPDDQNLAIYKWIRENATQKRG